MISEEIINDLAARLGDRRLRRRFQIQIRHAHRLWGQGRTLLHIENADWLCVGLYWGLRLTGMYGRGVRNFHDIRLVENPVTLKNLPDPFDGYRILHLSDLHIDIDPDLTDIVIDRVKKIKCDLCVLTGDYRAHTTGDYEQTIADMKRIIEALPTPVYGVLGNHDFIEFVPPFERAGMRILLNETVPIERDGVSLYLAGVDDPHFYRLDDVRKVAHFIPAYSPSILLAHTPAIYREAAAAGFDFMLCGHTHGGQICLPGRIPIVANAHCPRRFVYGSWVFGRMKGYTSGGTGGCGLPVRFFCPPEMTIHELRKARSQPQT